MSEKKKQIIEAAIQMMRDGGYNTFSFRDIADEVGVKSSSVHHHFRRKENLAIAAVEKYKERFFEALGPSFDPETTAKAKFQRYASVFISAFEASGRTCLCGILSNESPMLPEAVTKEVSRFVDENLDWLADAYLSGSSEIRSEESKSFALVTYSSLEGAMATATLKKDVKWLRLVCDQIEETL
ncbi:TetR/AcrR family transcriptional regulator [Puniceicoccaceae bacterium K14]|nr:TetR/AcrR family transcriptional regulator [Puniceicoccaceae bacterium K14]